MSLLIVRRWGSRPDLLETWFVSPSAFHQITVEPPGGIWALKWTVPSRTPEPPFPSSWMDCKSY